MYNPKLKRRRSHAEADRAELQDRRKLFKFDSTVSTVSTLANNRSMSPAKLLGPHQPPKLHSPPTTGGHKASLRPHELQTPQSPHKPASFSSERTLPVLGIRDDTPLEHRTLLIECLYASEDVDLAFHPALHFQLLRSTHMKNDELAVCFDLISKTSQQDYKASSRGWHPTCKMEEMQDKEMMYLVVRQTEGYMGFEKVDVQKSGAQYIGAILGFLSFKLESEDEELHKMRPVLYIYEVHLDDRLRRRGLGGRIMKWAEDQARLAKISKAMLTVFTANEGARRMYEREGYGKDESSPEDRVTRRKVIKADYIIMSKEIA
ncbi:N-acetyltransferase [Ascochyta rabiei]|uniref:N-alpha-acetyltransferase 40 n=2 Tax=Didymella rabiei TaxID=5454 RepID=A0A163BAD9_DIDRA|nr:N-acetyltransferase [Ascochyta rabiei]